MRVPAPAPVAAEPIVEVGPTTLVAARTQEKPKRLGKRARKLETDIWDGMIRAPTKPETRLRESLLYPLWGATGIALLVFLPPLLFFASAMVAGAVSGLVTSGGSPISLGMLFVALPSVAGLTLLVGYALLYLGRVLALSALGEVHHPRWPDWEVSSILFGLGRWMWAGLVGVLVGGLPATAYWIYCGDIDVFDAIILVELAAVGAVYGLMAILVSILHEDALAANPITVVGAVWTVGWSYAQPCLVCGAAAVLAAAIFTAAFEVASPAFSAFLMYVFWFVALYETMVVLRVMGLFYFRHSRRLGWFRERTRWGV
jgi:hypothetical protein